MVRTKADAGSTKVSAAKAPRKAMSLGAGSSSNISSPSHAGSSKDRYSGGNAYNPQPTPSWQREISTFFKTSPSDSLIPKETSDHCPDTSNASSSSGGSSTSSAVKINPDTTEIS